MCLTDFLLISLSSFSFLLNFARMKTLILLLAIIFPALSVAQSKVSYHGKLDLGSVKLSIVLHINTHADGTYSATFDSPDQGAKGIAATVVHLSADSMNVGVPAIGASVCGRTDDKGMRGTFTQSGHTFPLLMQRGELLRKRPQTPATPLPYATEEVRFHNANDGAVLAGTLTLPLNYEAGKRVPVVLMVTGSGQQNRDEELFDHKPFAVIADAFARQGIATLRYDDRGVGQSTGDLQQMTTETNMQDASAGIKLLRADGRFGSVGVLGHSEGGCIAFMLAARGQADFIISMAGCGIAGEKILLAQNKQHLSLQGIMPDVQEDFAEVLQQVFNRIKANDLPANPAAAADSLLSGRKSAALPNVRQAIVGMLGDTTPWMRYFLSYDPSADIRATKCPVMAINGERDMQVHAASNIAAIREMLPKNEKNLIKTYPALNHLFQHATTGLPTEYGEIEETISPEVLADMAQWINGL